MWAANLLVCGLVSSFPGLTVHAAPALSCVPDHIDTTLRVRHVIDGDTVVLSDGRRLRLIGFDAPETGRAGKRDAPYANEARDLLHRLLLTHGHVIGLRLDVEHVDSHGRLLAHGFLGDGSSVTERMLAGGVATHLVIPPNQWSADCYRRAEGSARAAGLGLWSLPRYRPVASRSLDSRTTGYRRVRGRVIRAGESREALWLNLEGGFAVRIPHADLGFFETSPPRGLVGSVVEARGRIYRRNGELRMDVSHPAQLTVLRH